MLPHGGATERRHEVAAAEHQDVLGDPFEEGPVVGDGHDRAGPVVEEVLEGAEGVEVEVVGGLVEEQHVRPGRQHGHQLEATPLPTREHGDGRAVGVVLEPEPAQQRGVLGPWRLVRSRHHLEHGEVGGQMGAVLVEVADPHGRAVHDRPLRRGDAPRHDVEQRRLPRPVRADDAQAGPGIEQQVDVAEQDGAGGPGDADVVQLDHLATEAGRAGLRQADGPAPHALVGTGRLDDRPGDGEPGLRLAAPLPRPAPQPRQLAAGEDPAARLALLRLVRPLGHGVEVGPVPAVDGEPAVTAEGDDAGGHDVEEGPVVADHDHRAPPPGQLGLEPLHGGEIEVVGGLVEHQHVGGAGQRRRERDPAGLAAAQRRRRPVEQRRDTEAVGHRRRLPARADDLPRRPVTELGALRQRGDGDVARPTAPDRSRAPRRRP